MPGPLQRRPMVRRCGEVAGSRCAHLRPVYLHLPSAPTVYRLTQLVQVVEMQALQVEPQVAAHGTHLDVAAAQVAAGAGVGRE